MSRDKEFGGNEEIVALASALDMTIRVLTPYREYTFPPDQKGPLIDEILLGHDGVNHYYSLEPGKRQKSCNEIYVR